MSQALLLNQLKQLENPDGKIVLEQLGEADLLSNFAYSWQGIKTSDDERFTRCHWELCRISDGWWRYQRAPDGFSDFAGREETIFWEDGYGVLTLICQEGASFRGQSAWQKPGMAVSMMRNLPATVYGGQHFSADVSIIQAKKPEHLFAVYAYCMDPVYAIEVRKVDQALRATNKAMAQVPFDLDYWQKVADERYPDGLPEPHSDDPTQWLFRGDIPSSADPLHVALARLLGYAWPEQLDDGLGHLVDTDGIVTLTPLVNQEGVANRLRTLLQAAYQSPVPARPKGAPEVEEPRVWNETTLPRLLARAGSPGISLEDWLRDRFFESHCKLFQQRPFIWHIWDARKDGFQAFVNYHKFDSRNLDRLTHVYLGEWIERQRAASESGDRTADARLIAAQELQKKLELIRTGEPPYDIFVRWKSLAEQPMGWDPDLNDGVRMNIRPFVEAGILRGRVNVNWNKDRGKDPKPNASGTVERHNDRHFTLAEKRAAREAS